uniref:Uncharacterized protein n=1 Tax=Trichogramma kaykai TaxID=54128 RepID=A0ABD2VXE7_9HYME
MKASRRARRIVTFRLSAVVGSGSSSNAERRALATRLGTGLDGGPRRSRPRVIDRRMQITDPQFRLFLMID